MSTRNRSRFIPGARGIALWLIVCLMFSFGDAVKAEPAPYAGHIEVGNATGAQGDAVDVSVYVTPDDLVLEYDIYLQFDPNVLEPVQSQAVTDAMGLDPQDFTVYDAQNPGVIRITANLGVDALMERTEVFQAHFRIKSDAAPGTTQVEAGSGSRLNEDGWFEAAVTAGSITVESAAAPSAAVEIGSVSGQAGDTVNVPVTVTSAVYGIAAYEIEVHFDAAALELSTVAGEAGDYFDWNHDQANGWLRAAWVDIEGGDNPIGTGDKLFTIAFKVNNAATAGDKPLTVSSSGFSATDAALRAMETTVTPGKVAVTVLPTYTVTFDSQEGSPVDSIGPVGAGSKISAPAAPTRNGFTFAGWHINSAGTSEWNFNTDTVTANIVLYAKWLEDEVQSAPLAQNVVVSGTARVGQTLTGSYNYVDANGDAEGASLFKWYRSADASGTNKSVILGATARTYTLQAADLGSFISFEVTPIAATGILTGNAVESARTAAVEQASSNPDPKPDSTSLPAMNTGADVWINGRVERAGSIRTEQINGRQATIVEADEQKLGERLEQAGDRAVITIPVAASNDVVIGELNGRIVKSMETKQAVIEIRTPQASYTIPAGLIDIEAIAKRFGTAPALQDIKLRIEISAATDDAIQIAKQAASTSGLTIVAPPLEFNVTAVYGDRTEPVANFSAYVERMIALPDDVDPSRITTGVVIEPDGTVRHVPTKVEKIEGRYYARMNSLTNSTYAVVWHPLTFGDLDGHWAKQAANNLGARLVVSGAGDDRFDPNGRITRAEFAATVVRGLGLKPAVGEFGERVFADVDDSAGYAGAVRTAYAYGLVGGSADGTFKPDDSITREQAMVVIARAMAIVRLQGVPEDRRPEETIRAFADAEAVSGWALQGVADSVSAGIVSGRTGDALKPKAYLTRAEAAMLLLRLLQKSDLID